MDKSCWIIVGATSAIAHRFAHYVAKQGNQIILLGRDQLKLHDIAMDLNIRFEVSVDAMYFDAEKTDDFVSLVDNVIPKAHYPISIFIAFGLMGLENAIAHSPAMVAKIMQTNLTGAASITYAFLPYLQNQKKGDLIFLGSVAGDRGRIPNFVYGAAKAGLATFCEGLRGALLPQGINVTLMKPGYIDTPMTYGIKKIFPEASPESCAKACFDAAKKKQSVAYFPTFWWFVMMIFKFLPQSILYRFKA